MSTSSGESQFFSEFLDDFFAESEEHLALARRILLGLEDAPHDPDLAQIDELFRAFHSLKGLAGMVGVGEIEHLAHELESLLRALRKGDVELGDEVLDALIGGVRLLEQCLAARKSGIAAPSVDAAARTLADLTEGRRSASPAPAAQGGEESAKIAAALGQGQRIWRIMFTPSAALAERGVHVNSVRERLLALGELLRAAPQVTPGVGLTFDFVLASAAPEGSFEGWADDGLDVAPYAPRAAPSPPPSPPAQPASPVSPIASGTVVRVDLDRLDDLMRMVGDLVISNARLEAQIAQAAPLLPTADARALRDLAGAFQRQIRSLRAGVMRTRLVPIGESFGRIQFMARDLARDLGRQVAVTIQGEHTEIDKFLVDRLMDPLMHLVRNALSHGLEPPQERAAQGKPGAGRLALSATADGEHVVVTVADDGRGIDIERVAARARAHGLLAEGEELAPDRLLDILCAPGFSTREQADRVSGRGVGMDVVSNAVHELRGSLALETTAGRGTTFTLRLPLTLAIMDALLVAVADQRFAIPISAIREIITLEPGQITPLERNELLTHRGVPLPLVRIAQRFQIAGAARYGHACVVGEGGGAAALVFDRPLGKREIVVRPLTDPLVAQPYLAGATELGDGRVVLLLDVAALLRPASAARESRP